MTKARRAVQVGAWIQAVDPAARVEPLTRIDASHLVRKICFSGIITIPGSRLPISPHGLQKYHLPGVCSHSNALSAQVYFVSCVQANLSIALPRKPANR